MTKSETLTSSNAYEDISDEQLERRAEELIVRIDLDLKDIGDKTAKVIILKKEFDSIVEELKKRGYKEAT